MRKVCTIFLSLYTEFAEISLLDPVIPVFPRIIRVRWQSVHPRCRIIECLAGIYLVHKILWVTVVRLFSLEPFLPWMASSSTAEIFSVSTHRLVNGTSASWSRLRQATVPALPFLSSEKDLASMKIDDCSRRKSQATQGTWLNGSGRTQVSVAFQWGFVSGGSITCVPTSTSLYINPDRWRNFTWILASFSSSVRVLSKSALASSDKCLFSLMFTVVQKL